MWRRSPTSSRLSSSRRSSVFGSVSCLTRSDSAKDMFSASRSANGHSFSVVGQLAQPVHVDPRLQLVGLQHVRDLVAGHDDVPRAAVRKSSPATAWATLVGRDRVYTVVLLRVRCPSASDTVGTSTPCSIMRVA